MNIDPLETVIHAKSECLAWFKANNKQKEIPTAQQSSEQATISERCMIDGSWTHDIFFNSYGWTWKNSRGGIQLLGGRN